MNKNNVYTQSIKIEIPICLRCKKSPQEYYKLWNNTIICKCCYEEMNDIIKLHEKENAD